MSVELVGQSSRSTTEHLTCLEIKCSELYFRTSLGNNLRLMSDLDLLPAAVLRQIGDKLYEKRKVSEV